MLTIKNEKFVKFSDGETSVIAEIFVDMTNELPPVDFEGRTLHQGSIALIISEGKIAVLGGDGQWRINGEVVE